MTAFHESDEATSTHLDSEFTSIVPNVLPAPGGPKAGVEGMRLLDDIQRVSLPARLGKGMSETAFPPLDSQAHAINPRILFRAADSGCDSYIPLA